MVPLFLGFQHPMLIRPNYHFSCEYIDSNTKGEIMRDRMVEADLTVIPKEEVWTNVTVAEKEENRWRSPQPQEFMQGFRYSSADTKEAFSPSFFKGFPPTAIEEKNLVWDTMMFEHFAAYANTVRPGVNTPFRSEEVQLGGSGTFKNTDVELTALGMATFNGQRCKVMKYIAFFNRVNITAPGVHLIGRSHYWGEIWISSKRNRIVLGTLYEDVLGELTLGNSSGPRVVDVFRKGTLRAVY